jgi:hyperosmotically inducible protein
MLPLYPRSRQYIANSKIEEGGNMNRIFFIFIVALSLVVPTTASAAVASQSQAKAKLRNPEDRDARTRMTLAAEVRHQLLTLPYYGIFDWLEADVKPDGTITLRGEVVRPVTKSDAESRVKKLEGVKTVTNQIETLPLSSFDDETRVAIYRKLVRELGLEKYFLQAVPPIHIIVKGGHVTLKGLVASGMDSQLAYTAASSVPNVFDVKNELRVENS